MPDTRPRYGTEEIPPDLEIHTQARRPVDDPTLGIPVPLPPLLTAPSHRLVAIGDSITHGFMSLAIHKTWLSWPAMVAHELGLDVGTEFRVPVYEDKDGPGGLPLDLERVARHFEERFGPTLDAYEVPLVLHWLRRYADRIEDHWERGDGTRRPPPPEPYHNLAVYGYDLLDTLTTNAEVLRGVLAKKPSRDHWLAELPENDGVRAGLVVLDPVRDPTGDPGTVYDAARHFGADGIAGEPGIETLVVALGSNCALGSVVSLRATWSTPAFEALSLSGRQAVKRGKDPVTDRAVEEAVTVWHPRAFADEWAAVVRQLRTVRARHVIVATVPSVTIAPIARGVGGKWDADLRFFHHYARPWVEDGDFGPGDDHITKEQAQAVDSAIDAYNATIVESVRAARADGLDWYVFDMGGLLERLAYRRYVHGVTEPPSWWTEYELPPQLKNHPDGKVTTQFFRSGPDGRRTQGGLFSLDGVHPTTSGYGVIAHEVIRVMTAAGVAFPTRHRGGPGVDFDRIVALDTLVGNPPGAITGTLDLIRRIDNALGWVRGLVR